MTSLFFKSCPYVMIYEMPPPATLPQRHHTWLTAFVLIFTHIALQCATHACPHKHIIHTLTQKQQPPPMRTDLCTDFLVKPVRISRLLPTREFSIFGFANPRLPLFVSLSLPSLAGHPVLLTYANVYFVTHFTYVSFPSVCCSQWTN